MSSRRHGAFLSLPRGSPKHVCTPVPAGSPEAARQLFAVSRPIRRTLVEIYLGNRGIETVHDAGALRFHPRCYYRPARDADASGDMALAALTGRAEAAGIEALASSPRLGDFNEDLQAFGLGALQAALRLQIAPMDVVRFESSLRAGAV
jgi:hypothetical protein